MKLEPLFREKPCVFALEVFPPKKQSGIGSVHKTLDELGSLPVDYISVTYSAGGGGAKEYTAQLAKRLKEKQGIEPLAHLTCYSSSREEIELRLGELREAGVENILALRGDKLPGVEPCRDLRYASDLVTAIREYGDYYIVGACYPEGHPESGDLAEDIENTKHKMEAGTGHLVSQMFFDNGRFFRYLNLLRKKGIGCPVEAGVMPIVRKEQIQRTIALSSASIPAAMSKLFTKYEDDAEGFYDAGIDYAVRQCRDLIESGVDGIHLYAMNKPDVAKRVYEGIADLL